jgi:hypothetical protein
MQLRVQHADGKIEVLTLNGSWTAVEGDHLDILRNDRGFEHFFTKTGHYDGWGGLVETSRDTEAMIDAIESKREFPKED